MRKAITFVGMDAHKVSITLAVLFPEQVKPVEWQVANEKAAVRRMVRKVQRLAAGGEVSFCYEAVRAATRCSAGSGRRAPRAWLSPRR